VIATVKVLGLWAHDLGTVVAAAMSAARTPT